MADDLSDIKTKLAIAQLELENSKLDMHIYQQASEKLGYAIIILLGLFALLWVLYK